MQKAYANYWHDKFFFNRVTCYYFIYKSAQTHASVFEEHLQEHTTRGAFRTLLVLVGQVVLHNSLSLCLFCVHVGRKFLPPKLLPKSQCPPRAAKDYLGVCLALRGAPLAVCYHNEVVLARQVFAPASACSAGHAYLLVIAASEHLSQLG